MSTKDPIKKDEKTGNYYFRVDVGRHPKTGERKQKYQSFRNKKDAKAALISIQHQVSEGSYFEPSKEDFPIFMNKWFDRVYRRGVEVTTAESRKHFMDKHILTYFERFKISEINTFQIDEFYEDCLDNGLAPASIKIIHSLLNQAFKKAVKWKLVKFNPVTDSSPPPVKNKRITGLWNEEETKRFIAKVKEKNEESKYVPTIFTGIRRGEMLGLKWEDIDFNEGTIHIQRSLTRTKSNGIIFKDVKTESSNRVIATSNYIINLLLEHKSRQDKQKERLGTAYFDHGLVNCTIDGKPIDPGNLLRQFHKLMGEADVPKISYHDLRHLHATFLMAMGENPKIVQERLGHSRVQVTLDTYTHVNVEMQRQSANKFEERMLNS
ncbi:integrase [Mesobacillus campisalis]|uniref:Integrase n=1 Tax=Mesobacillus campisalis TaxID=1408103 RepID=A0A0M2SR11_9BACI|nr:site-specific integrase [Mesobacillus campisalis]KKK37009.1 integrase [Mesobacillus campisalis]